MMGTVWGANNVSPGAWMEILLLSLSTEFSETIKTIPRKQATLADAVIWLKTEGISTDISTLSRMKRVTDCHSSVSSSMEEIRTKIITKVGLEACFCYFEHKLLSALMFIMPYGDMGSVQKICIPNGLYEGLRFSLRGKKMITRSAFLFYQNDRVDEPLSSYSNTDRGTYNSQPLSGVYRYRELRKIVPQDDPTFYVHVRGFVFHQNGGFYLIGMGLETTSKKPTSELRLEDIRRSQIENDFLDDDQNPAIVRGIKPAFLRSPAHPAAGVIELSRVANSENIPWDSVSKFVTVGTLGSEKFLDKEELERLNFKQDKETGMLKVTTFSD